MPNLKQLTYDARKKTLSLWFDISVATNIPYVFCDPDLDCWIERITTRYNVATNDGTILSNVTVGIPGTPALYLDYTPIISQAAGTLVVHTPLSAIKIPAGTPLIIQRSNATAGTNTGDVTTCVEIVQSEKRYRLGRVR